MVNKQHFLMQSESGIPKPQTPKEKPNKQGKGEGSVPQNPKSTATQDPASGV